MESPDVRFEDVLVITSDIFGTGSVKLDQRFIDVCEPDSIEIVAVTTDTPVAVGVRLLNGHVQLRSRSSGCVRAVITVSGIRKGFADVRFTPHTEEEYEQNRRFWNWRKPS